MVFIFLHIIHLYLLIGKTKAKGVLARGNFCPFENQARKLKNGICVRCGKKHLSYSGSHRIKSQNERASVSMNIHFHGIDCHYRHRRSIQLSLGILTPLSPTSCILHLHEIFRSVKMDHEIQNACFTSNQTMFGNCCSASF